MAVPVRYPTLTVTIILTLGTFSRLLYNQSKCPLSSVYSPLHLCYDEMQSLHNEVKQILTSVAVLCVELWQIIIGNTAVLQ